MSPTSSSATPAPTGSGCCPLSTGWKQAGVKTWIDREGIHGGANYAQVINDAIQGSAALLLCRLTGLACRPVTSSRRSPSAGAMRSPILPLLLEPVTIPGELAYWLEGSQWIEVLDHPEQLWLADVAKALQPYGIAVQRPAATAGRQRKLPPIAGRDRELGLLRERLAAAQEGLGSLALIGGEAGIGKTALAEAALASAEEQGFVVLEGHCFDLAETPPYGPWIDLFAHCPASAGVSLPEAFAVRGTVGTVPGQIALFTQVEDFLRTLSARQSVALLLDDLHWSDPASLDLLRYLAHAVSSLPLLILVTYRSDELTRRHPLYALLPALGREAAVARIDLGRLDELAVRELVAGRYDLSAAEAARLSAYVQSRAEGNALFLGELLRTLEESGELVLASDGWVIGSLADRVVPPVLRQVIESRVARLDEGSQRLLGVAAVIGQTVPLDIWRAVGEVDEDYILDLSERAESARLLEGAADAASVRFSHALIREALYESLPSLRRRRLHRQVGEVLSTTSSPDPDQVATHFQQAGDQRAVEWLVRSGERAQLAYAWPTAIQRYEAALQLLANADRDEAQQGWLSYRIGRLGRHTTFQQSIAYLDEALRIAEQVGDVALAAAARYSRGLCWFNASVFPAAIEEMAEGAEALEALPLAQQARLDLEPDEHGMPIVTNPRGMLVTVLAASGHLIEAVRMGAATQEGVPRHTPLGELGWAHYGDRHCGLGVAYALLGQPEAAHHAFAQAQAIYRRLGHFSTLGVACFLEFMDVSLPYDTERLDQHWRLVQQAVEAWQRSFTVDSQSLKMVSLPLRRLLGEWAAVRLAAVSGWQRSGWYLTQAAGSIALAHVALDQGDHELTQSIVRSLLPDGPRSAPETAEIGFALASIRLGAALSLATQDLATARPWLEAHDRWLDWSGAILGRAEGALLWAQYRHANGDVTQARTLAEQALAHASDPRQPLALIAVHRFLGQLDTENAELDAAEEHLQQSLQLADACHAPFERALTLLELAKLRAEQGRTDEAKALVGEVRDICEPLEAKPTLERVAAVEQELTSAGAADA